MIAWFNSERRAREAAARWVLRHVDQRRDDDAAFTRWLARHPDHARYYEECDSLWRDEAIEQALRSVRVIRPQPASPRHSFAAAGVCALLLVGFFVLSRWTGPAQQTMHYQTEPGHSLSTRLADGSQVELNGDSEITVSFAADRRLITLRRGEGFFDVAHDESRPFMITAGAAQVTVIGTAFDLQVNEPGDEVELVVYRGRVEMAASKFDRAHHVAEAGERLRLTAGSLRRLNDFDPDGGDWRNGWLQIDDITLTQLVRQLNRISSRRIEIASAKLGELRVAGRLHIGEPDQLLEKLAASRHFQVKQADGKLLLTL